MQGRRQADTIIVHHRSSSSPSNRIHNIGTMTAVNLSTTLRLFAALNCIGVNSSFVGVEAFVAAPSRIATVPCPQNHLTSTINRKSISSPPHQRYTKTHRQSTPASNNDVDSLVNLASKKLTAAGWFSWWSQVILTVISSVTFIFARNVMESQTASPIEFGRVASKFVLPGVGIVTSIMSIIWTWGGRRLARRFVRKQTSQVEAANLLRRVITVGCTLNLIGLLTSLLGAQYIVGTLVAKAMQNVVGFGGNMGGLVASQTLQPLDVLVVQANTNVLTSHFMSLACFLWLTRMVDLLDPPSLEEDV